MFIKKSKRTHDRHKQSKNVTIFVFVRLFITYFCRTHVQADVRIQM